MDHTSSIPVDLDLPGVLCPVASFSRLKSVVELKHLAVQSVSAFSVCPVDFERAGVLGVTLKRGTGVFLRWSRKKRQRMVHCGQGGASGHT